MENGKGFNIVMSEKMFNRLDVIRPEVEVIIKAKWWILRLLGFNYMYEAEVTSAPIQVTNGWEYSIKLNIRHFRWLRFKLHTTKIQ